MSGFENPRLGPFLGEVMTSLQRCPLEWSLMDFEGATCWRHRSSDVIVGLNPNSMAAWVVGHDTLDEYQALCLGAVIRLNYVPDPPPPDQTEAERKWYGARA